MHKNAQVGPDPETIPARAPADSPARSVRRNSGFKLTAAACNSLPSRGASRRASPAASAPKSSSGSASRGGSPFSRSRSISLKTWGVDSPPSANANTQ
ncbi:Uncharacterised protein [Mycobacteroides abscessus subsp. abscessus]|nr:Uncharacterised protein [Mycobacteroides abscessus subsp. abscessus]